MTSSMASRRRASGRSAVLHQLDAERSGCPDVIELGLEAREQFERIRGRAGEARQHAAW